MVKLDWRWVSSFRLSIKGFKSSAEAKQGIHAPYNFTDAPYFLRS